MQSNMGFDGSSLGFHCFRHGESFKMLGENGSTMRMSKSLPIHQKKGKIRCSLGPSVDEPEVNIDPETGMDNAIRDRLEPRDHDAWCVDDGNSASKEFDRTDEHAPTADVKHGTSDRIVHTG